MSITFSRKDEIDSFIVPTTIKIADHFSVKREYILSFCHIVRLSSKWTIENMPKHLRFIKSKFTVFAGGEELVKILDEAFSKCNDKEDIDKLRGSLTEGLLLGAYGDSIVNSKSFGWGAQVNIKNGIATLRVKYRCPLHCDSEQPECVSRSTVDLGFWDGSYGEFFECKVRPDSIGCSEINYMKLLNKELSKRGLKHNLYFVTTDTSDSMEMKMKNKHPKESFFKIISLQEISA
ncbi:hypothetical protein P8846_11285 [Bacillus spizizenii]|nr:hypothetical protein JN25_16250 [Bacillus sp. BSC154]MCY8059660.1 hypothetical protein [Bacillus spizizenii]MDU7578579.1 hypothetical protein [Bacillus subtilis]MCY8114759.1 hypothetical protein [Bacillus spizizenii]MCY8128692.1 hypothetical protein [Bacillus spizizenii]